MCGLPLDAAIVNKTKLLENAHEEAKASKPFGAKPADSYTFLTSVVAAIMGMAALGVPQVIIARDMALFLLMFLMAARPSEMTKYCPLVENITVSKFTS